MRMSRLDRAAFEQIYDRYAGKAPGICIRLLGDCLVDKDVLQESFWRAWQKADSFDTACASFTTWLFSIVHHSAIDKLRKRRSRDGVSKMIELDANTDEAHTIPDPHPSVMTTVMANIQDEHMHTALAQLPESHHSIITLAYYGGYNRQEIAAHLGQPLGTIYTRARLGLSKLRDLLAEMKV